MNYYRRHIGDYLRDTSHLSLLEHGVYTRLLDVYYTREEPIPAGASLRLVGARTKEEKAAVDRVLQEFFVLLDGDWHQARCDREIETYTEKADRNRAVGKLGGRPKKPTNNPDGFQNEPREKPKENPDETHSQEPIANSHKKEKERTPKPPSAAPPAKRSKARSAFALEALPDDWREKAVQQLPGWDYDGLFRAFRNYHLGKSTLAGSWSATWGSWLDNAPQYSRQFAPSGPAVNGRQNVEDRNAAFAAEWTGGLMGHTSDRTETFDMEPDRNERLAIKSDRH